MFDVAKDTESETELIAFKEQLEQFTSSIQTSSPYSALQLESLYNVGVHLYQKGDWSNASLFFGIVNLLDPLNATYLTAQGKCLKSMEAYEKAYEVFYLAWGVDNSLPASALHAAECLMLCDRKDDAALVINEVLAKPSMSGRNQELRDRAEAWLKLLEAGERHG